jgi:uncharacterized protein YjbI with pentapeptide repeats
MDIKNIYDAVIFTSAALTIRDAMDEAVSKKINLGYANLRGTNLRGANLEGANLGGANLGGTYLEGANLRGANLRGTNLEGANLRGTNLRGTYLEGANLRGAKIYSMRVFSGLYDYQVWAVLFEDGSRWVRMGCLFKSLEDWEKIGIRKSNISQYPDDGSEQCEERVAAFEFAKAAVLRMKLPASEAAAK